MTHAPFPIGIYEKALPAAIGWPERCAMARRAGFDYLELSLDPSEERLSRLRWSMAQRRAFRAQVEDAGFRIHSMCLSAHRSFPLGDPDPAIRRRGLDVLEAAIGLASDLGIRIVQLAGYDTRGEPSTPATQALYREALHHGVRWAAAAGVLLGLENQETGYIDSPTTAAEVCAQIGSPYLHLYMDVGNIIVQDRDPLREITAARGRLVALHIKDARPATPRHVPFGAGTVPFEACFRLLAEGGFCGPALIEMWNEHAPDAEAIVTAARAFVVERLAAAYSVAG